MASFSNDSFIIAALISRSQQGSLTAEEQARLDAWIAASDEHQQLWEELNNAEVQQENVRAMAQFNENDALKRFLSNKPAAVTSFRLRFLHQWKWAAAILVLAVGVSTYFILNNRQGIDSPGRALAHGDIPPGKNGAILTLADGRQLVLDSIGDGTIANQNGTEISLSNDQLVYDASATTGKVANNTITTPKGRQFSITLPDGTKVWLNAASSIEYPVAFNGNERRVKISGELYFDVANKSWQPFIVETDNLKVEVLGTSFNINSYSDEKTVQTTLLTGAVKLTPKLSGRDADVKGDKNQSKVLVPGQTGIFDRDELQTGNALTVTDTKDPGKTTAWKDGLFNFDGVDLYSVMRQLERWYDIEVRYVVKPDNVIFKGKMYRKTNLSDVLKVLETMEVNFELKGNILYVK